MDELISNLKNMSEQDARVYIKMLFDGYAKRKEENRLFEQTKIPEMVILTYYTCIKNPPFKKIYEGFKNKYIKNFKEKYVYNENKLENVHSKDEIEGLKLVYDFIESMEDYENISLYTLSDIHELLYSKTPYPFFGGQYRRDERYLPNSGIDVTSPYLIVHEMNSLSDDVNNLVREGISLGQKIDTSKILQYIKKCLELKCKLIKIHPFGDGNGRSIRAFINLLFRLANIPPVYIEDGERQKYGIAMQKAVGDGDLSKLETFYHFKICDSIYELDIEKNYQEEDIKTNKKV